MGNLTRTALTTNDNFSAFSLWGFDGSGAVFADGTAFTKEMTTGTWGSSASLVWPLSGNCDFYGAAPSGVSLDTSTRSFAYTCPAADNATQQDVLVASKLAASKTDNNGKVELSFNHALSFVRFKSSNTLDGFNIEISEVRLCNLVADGTFTFSETSESTGSWTLGNTTDNYTVAPAEPVSLTSADAYIDDADGVLMVMPQTPTAWDPTTDGRATASTKCYLEVACKVSTSASTPYYYVGSASVYGKLYFPFSRELKQNTRHTFRLTFGGYDENGQEVLSAVQVLPGIAARVAAWITEDEEELVM